MKPNKHASIDGFIPRRPGVIHDGSSSQATPRRDLARPQTTQSRHDQNHTLPNPVARSDVEESLRSIDDDQPAPVRAPRRRFRPSKKLVKRIIIALVLLLVVGGAYFGIKTFILSNKLFHGSIFSLITPGAPLKTDSQGRTNILIFGTSQDDAAHQNADGGGGLWLTDSIMLASINQKTKTISTVSIPRDLWVELDSNCGFGSASKINAVYECAAGLVNSDGTPGSDYADRDKKGAEALMSTVSDVTGVTPQYYAHVNYSVLKQSVDALGGIDVNIEGDGADGIYDTNFDWNCPGARPYTCKNVYYPHNGTYKLDGLQALYLARARADSGLYSYKDFGLARGDFDRQMNQQKILQALMAKAKSAGTLTNPVKISQLMDALGNNVTTSFSTGEVKTLIEFSGKLGGNALKSIPLVGGDTDVVETGSAGGQSVVLATSGLFDYSSIIDYLSQKLSTNPAVSEGAKIGVYNASGIPGAAGNLQTTLENAGLIVDTAGNASSSDAGGAYTIYDTTSGKMPQTLKYLQQNLKGATVSTAAVPSDIISNDDIIIVIGAGASNAPTN